MLSLLKKQAVFSSLLDKIRQGRLAHCYLLESESMEAAQGIARMVASALFCGDESKDRRPCFDCPACRRVLAGEHVDVHTLNAYDAGKRVPLAEVRAFLQDNFVSPCEGDWRVFIIENAQELSIAAQNALLKAIEETPPNTVYFLLTCDISRLLPTVRSRAVRERLTPFTEEEIYSLLRKEQIPDSIARDACRFAFGSIDRARRYATDEAFQAMKRTVEEYFAALEEGAGFTRLCLIVPPGALKRPDLYLFFSLVKLALRDLLCYHLGLSPDPLFFTDRRRLTDLALAISARQCADLFDETENFLFAKDRNVNVYASLCAFHEKAQNLCREPFEERFSSLFIS